MNSNLKTVEEVGNNPRGLNDLDSMYSMQDFKKVLSTWWGEIDNHRGNMYLSAEKIAHHFVKMNISNEVETTRRSLLL